MKRLVIDRVSDQFHICWVQSAQADVQKTLGKVDFFNALIHVQKKTCNSYGVRLVFTSVGFRAPSQMYKKP